MATVKYAVNSTLGVNFNNVDVGNTVAGALAKYRVGERVPDNMNGMWVYAQIAPNTAAMVQGNSYHITGAGVALPATTTLALRGMRLGIPAVTVPLDAANYQYVWMQTSGQCEGIRVAISCAARVRLNTTATAGLLDDDATTGAKTADGCTIDTAEPGTATATIAGILIDAAVGATL